MIYPSGLDRLTRVIELKKNNTYLSSYGKTILLILIIGGLLGVSITINWL